MRSDELIISIKKGRSAIFGTGYVAGMLWKALEINQVEDYPDFFLVNYGETKKIYGKPVKTLSKTFVDDRLILIAVHEANYREVDIILEKAGWRNRIWVYPYLHELLFGPVLERKQISLKKLLIAQDPKKYWLAVRLCGIEGWKDIYCKTMALHSSLKTAEIRYKNLQAIKQNMEGKGYDQNCPILIDKQYRIIDGLHRVALCRSLGIEMIPADIVAACEVYEQLFSDDNQLPRQMLRKAQLTDDETLKVLKAQQKLLVEGELIISCVDKECL